MARQCMEAGMAEIAKNSILAEISAVSRKSWAGQQAGSVSQHTAE